MHPVLLIPWRIPVPTQNAIQYSFGAAAIVKALSVQKIQDQCLVNCVLGSFLWVNVPFSSWSLATEVSVLSSCQSRMGMYPVTTESGPDQIGPWAWIFIASYEAVSSLTSKRPLQVFSFILSCAPSRKYLKAIRRGNKKDSWAFYRIAKESSTSLPLKGSVLISPKWVRKSVPKGIRTTQGDCHSTYRPGDE